MCISYLVNDNDDLSRRANNLLVRMCGVVPPLALVNPVIDAIFLALKTSPVSSPTLYLPGSQHAYGRKSLGESA